MSEPNSEYDIPLPAAGSSDPATNPPPDDVAAEADGPVPAAETAGSNRPDDGWSLIALVPHDGVEPPASVSESLAQAVWCAVSAIWHPSLLARARELPRIEPI
jgi:alpha-mannosidase